MSIEASFKEGLLKRIEEVISSSPYPISLYDIIYQLQGASPVEVVSMLNDHKIHYVIDERALLISSNSANNLYAKKTSSSPIFATPHPADYDWRFTEETILFLLYYIKAILTPFDKIALLGAQTLYPICKKNGLDAVLFNKSISIINDLKKAGFSEGLVQKDLFDNLDIYHNTFKVVVSDPPWYLEHYQAFINRSSEILQINGYLLISVLPKLTRPSAIEDRVKIKEFAESSGFEFIKNDEASLLYETPLFEEQSLVANGIYCDDWRTGDLWIFKKIKNIDHFDYNIDCIIDPVWFEYRIDDKRIKLRKKDITEGEVFTFENADNNGKILSNVSRRYAARDRIDIWTSDNIAFKLTRSDLLQTCLSILETSSMEEVIKYLNGDESIALREFEDILNLLHEIT